MSQDAIIELRSEKAGRAFGHRPLQVLLTMTIALLLGASFSFSRSVSAHDIDLAGAREIARDYARSVRADSDGKYLHYTTSCYKLFQGHNHYVRCTIEYTDDAHPGGTESALCREVMDVYFQPHGNGVRYEYWIRHHDGPCGKRRLNGTMWRLRD